MTSFCLNALSTHTRKTAVAGFSALLLAAGLACGAVQAQERPVPPGGTALLPGDGLDSFVTFAADTAAASRVDVTGQPFTRALHLVTMKQPANTWDLQAQAKTIAPIKKGDVCLATFSMRVLQSGGGYGRTDLVLEDTASYSKILMFEASASPVWKKFYAPFEVKQDEDAGHAQVNLHMGFLPQTIEVADVHLTDYGTSVKLSDLPQTTYSYDGRALDAPWRKAAGARIEKYRKGNVVVHVVDAQGRAAPGASVHLAQTRHLFGFGTALDNIFIQDRPDSRQYRDLTYALYNEAVVGNNLKSWPWETGGTDQYGDPYTHAEALRFLQTLHAHGMKVRGHNLVWPSWSYDGELETLKNNPPALAAHILAHIKDEVTTLKGQCFEWDVVNEPYNNHDVQDILGPHCLVDWYNAAHAADPAARLYINDYGMTESNADDTAHTIAYEKQIHYLLDNKAPLGGIGLQSHFGPILTSPDRVYAVLDRFAKFGLPLEVTEFDVNVPEEQLQSDYLRDYMTITFSHPAVSGFVMWGFWAGDHWLPDAALYRKDFAIKPNAEEYKKLVFHDWWTDATGQTDPAGTYRTRGFLGSYLVTVTQNGRTKTVPTTITKSGDGIASITVTL